MLIFILTSLAAAGTIQVTSSSPVGIRVDSEWIGRSTTEAESGALSEGRHLVEIVNLVGSVVAFDEVLVPAEGTVRLSWQNKRLERIGQEVAPATVGAAPQQAPMDEVSFRELQAGLLKAPLKKMKWNKLDSAAHGNWFTVRQVDQLLGLFTTLDDRVAALDMLAAKVVDPTSYVRLEHHFPTATTRAHLQELFASE